MSKYGLPSAGRSTTCIPLFSRGKGEERIFPKKLPLDKRVPRLIWSQDSDASHFLGLMANEANQPSMNKMSVRRTEMCTFPLKRPCVPGKAICWHWARTEGPYKRPILCMSRAGEMPCPWNRLLLFKPLRTGRSIGCCWVLWLLHSFRLKDCHRKGCLSIAVMQHHGTSVW